MKKLLLMFAIGCLCFAQGGTLTPSGPPNYAVNVSFNASLLWASPTNAAALQFNWSASAGTSITGITLPANIAAAKQITCGGTFPQASGSCIIVGLNTTAILVGPVTILATTAAGTTPATPVVITISNVQAADGSGSAIASTGGALSIPFATSKCDLDANGAVNINDITIAAQRIVATPQITPCDFDGSGGMCNLFDAIVIWKAALGGACTAP